MVGARKETLGGDYRGPVPFPLTDEIGEGNLGGWKITKRSKLMNTFEENLKGSVRERLTNPVNFGYFPI